MRHPDLSPSFDTLDAITDKDATNRASSAPPSDDAHDTKRRLEERVDEWLMTDAGRRNVRDGRVPPTFIDVLRRADLDFTPTKKIIPARMRHLGAEIWRSYRQAAAAYSKSSAPLRADAPPAFTPGVTPPMLEGQRDLDEKTHGGTKTLAALLCVRIRTGTDYDIVTTRRSGVTAIDVLARRALERSLAARPLPTETHNTVACYRFAVDFGRTAPSLSSLAKCALTGRLHKKSCLMNERFSRRVTLDRVHALRRANALRPNRSPKGDVAER